MFSFTVSIDGNQILHDSCRVDFNGNGSYNKAISAVKHYREHYKPLLSTKMTISPENINYLYPAVINLINENFIYINLNCIFEKGWEWHHASILYKEMIKIADYIIDNNLNDKIFVSLFNEDAFVPMEYTENLNWCGGVNNMMLALHPSGELYTCIRYMKSSLNNKQKPLPINNVHNINEVNLEYNKNFELLSGITRSSQSSDECIKCPIAAGCAWCSGYNYEEFGTPNKRATYICCMHKARALANVYYWNKIYSKHNIDKEFKNYLSKEDI
jgi:radical SAM peptide maturase (CXXX-repeat target family)